MILAALTTAPAPTPAQPELPEIKDIAPPLDIFPWPTWMVVCATIVALAVLAGIVALIVIKKRNLPKPPPPTPRETALRELEAMRPQVERQPPYEFSIAVSDVLRSYIGAQYRLHAREQTSPEFLAAISRSVKFSENEKGLLAGFLERCDLIKFARIDATNKDSGDLLGNAIAFVEGERV